MQSCSHLGLGVSQPQQLSTGAERRVSVQTGAERLSREYGQEQDLANP